MISLEKLAIYYGVPGEPSAEAQEVVRKLTDRGVNLSVEEDSSP
jgi:hypothetical protein